MTRYHGVFAPKRRLRTQVTPAGRGKRGLARCPPPQPLLESASLTDDPPPQGVWIAYTYALTELDAIRSLADEYPVASRIRKIWQSIRCCKTVDWQKWFEAAGIGGVPVERRVRLNDLALVLQAAVDGQGVALGDSLLAGDDLAAARLVKPFDIETPCGAYWLVGAASGPVSSAQLDFRLWLRRELGIPAPGKQAA